jgi:hypothetical protein
LTVKQEKHLLPRPPHPISLDDALSWDKSSQDKDDKKEVSDKMSSGTSGGGSPLDVVETKLEATEEPERANDTGRLSLTNRELRNVDFLFENSLLPHIDYIPNSVVVVPSLKFLRTLDLSRNRLDALPGELFSLCVGLVSLDVSRNQLRGLPKEISLLVNLSCFNGLSNHFRYIFLPVKEIAELPALTSLDLRYNRKLKQAAQVALLAALPERVVLRCFTPPKEGSKLSAGERDAECLQSQLEPLSTPQLRKRLEKTFGVVLDEEMCHDRNIVMERLLACYFDGRGHPDSPVRTIRYEQGVLLSPETQRDLLAEMEMIQWRSTRERPKVSAECYMILQRPRADDTTSARGRTEAVKLARYQRLWDKAVQVMETVDRQFAARFTALAVTKNFRGSPHIDTLNVGPFYGLSLGDFDGGKICVECAATLVAEVDTQGRLAKLDGRFPHWVTKYTGTRYSLIYYVTYGEVIPQTTAVFEPPGLEEGMSVWVPPPSFVL